MQQPAPHPEIRRTRIRDGLLTVLVVGLLAGLMAFLALPAWAVASAAAVAAGIAVFGTRRIIVEAVDPAANEATIWCDDAGRIVGWNEAATFVLGWTQSEVRHADVFERIFCDHDLSDARRVVTQLGDRPRRVRRFFRVRSGEQLFLEAELARVLAGGFRLTLRRPPAQTMPPDSTPAVVRPTVQDKLNGVLPHVAFEVDTSGRLHRILEGNSDGLPRLFVGANLADVLPPEDARRMRAAFDEMRSTRQAVAFDGIDEAPIGLWVVKPGDNDRCIVTGIRKGSLLLQSIRARHEASERVKHEFLAMISHEIRTPLNGVIGMSEMLAGSVGEPEQKDVVQTIRNSAGALLKIVNDILSFSRPDQPTDELEPVPFSPRQVLEDVLELVAVRGAEKALDIAYEAPPTLPDELLGDAGRLRQVLLNLVDNAVKFTSAGSVAVTVESREVGRPGDGGGPRVMLRFTVTDTGVGIEPHVIPRLFQPFSQGDGSVRRRFGGTGLGLAISRRIAEQLGGAIGIDTSWKSGARFWFDVPFAVMRTADDDVQVWHGLRAWIIDPDPQSGRMVASRLDALGFTTGVLAPDTPSTPGAAMPDLLVFNMHMFEGGEAERAGHWCRRFPGVPSLLVGLAHQRIGDAIARALAPSGYLTKPIREESLRRRLTAILPERGAAALGPDRIAHGTVQMRAVTLGALKPRVLVAEDNPVNQMVARKLLERLGCEVHIAADGREAVDTSKLFSFDVVFMDCQMPGLDGFEATRRVRAYEGSVGAKRLPIVAMTANVMPGIVESCREAGMDDYISKPINQNVLQKALERWCPHLRFQPQ
jgi:PAS domain S-box-containing protein